MGEEGGTTKKYTKNTKNSTSNVDILVISKTLASKTFLWSLAEKDVGLCAQPAGSSSSWAGWAVTGVSSLTSKLIRNNPGAEGNVAAEGGRTANPSPTGASDGAPAPNKGLIYKMNK